MLAHWKQDLPASLVVFLVALPLCMGIALASGAPVATGLVTGIIGGLVVGFLAGSPLQVSGPAAGLTVVCAGVINQFGIAGLGAVVLIAGALQLAAGIFRLGQWFRAVSPAVVHGMLSGIGVLIVASQLHVMVDLRPHGHGLANLMAIPASLAKGLPLPEWDDAGVRQARISWLKSLSLLHERQGEIERSVARLVTQHGSPELHQREADQLSVFAPAQAALLAELRQLQQAQIEAPNELNSERSESLRASLDAATAALSSALIDLEQHHLETAEASQQAASESIAATLESLESHPWAAKLGLLTILLIVVWKRFASGRLAFIPPPLVAVVAAVLLAWGLSIPVLYVEVPDNLQNGLTFPTWSVFQDASARDLFLAGVTMAAIASAETLLCATAVDKMHDGPRTQYDRELCAQGIGNLLCGLLGALPMTGVIVRSAANVKAGAQTRLSAVLHGAWLLVFVLLLGSLLRMIPVSALAGTLVFIGFQLIDFKGFARLWKESRSEAFIMLVTLIVIVVEDLLTGVVTGVVLSAMKLLFTVSWLDVEMRDESLLHGRPRATLRLAGAATFVRLPTLVQALEKIPRGTELHFDLTQLDYIDHTCFDLLVNWTQRHEASDGNLVLDWNELHARLKEPQSKTANGVANTTG